MTWTRKQYLDRECSHDDYYAQFVNEAVTGYVVRVIGADKILASHDEHMNDIPLHRWDNLHSVKDLIDRPTFKAANNVTYAPAFADKFMWSLCDQVCIAKAAARAWARQRVSA